ncbi:MAG: hypothetical protein SPG80_06590 [Candidatus Ventricola sp.]|nr:hypothetical protein [Candidatus Ventricola sp.]
MQTILFHPDAEVQILAGVHDGAQTIAPEYMTWAHADRLHMQWHRMADVAAHREEGDYGTCVDNLQGG